MLTLFIDGAPKRQKPGAQAGAEVANLSFPSLVEAVEALLAHLRPEDQSA